MFHKRKFLSLDLFAFLIDESPKKFARLVALSIFVGIFNTAIVGIINASAQEVASGDSVTPQFFVFLMLTVGLLSLTKKSNKENIKSTHDLIYKFKLKIMRDVYNSDLETIDKVGRNYISEVLIRDTQNVSQNLGVIVTSFQSVSTLIFLSIYISTISVTAFIIVISSIFLFLASSAKQISSITDRLNSVANEESIVNKIYTDFLEGYKELKMNSFLTLDLTKEMMLQSKIVNEKKSDLIVHITNFLTVLQVLMYLVVAMIVFIVPLFSSDFSAQVTSAATTSLFLSATLTGLITSIPGFTQADVAAKSLKDLANRLETNTKYVETSDNQSPPVDFISLKLDKIYYTHASDSSSRGFSIGPISYEFLSGKIYFIRGGNGSGKTTLIRTLLGLYAPSSGSIILNNTPTISTCNDAYRNMFSVVFADFHLFNKLYGINCDNLEYINSIIELLQMKDKVSIIQNSFSTQQFSTGQRKRLALIVAILEGRPLIVLDEWAADQDPLFRKEFYTNILPILKSSGKTVIAITHDDQYFNLADELISMRNGIIDHV